MGSAARPGVRRRSARDISARAGPGRKPDPARGLHIAWLSPAPKVLPMTAPDTPPRDAREARRLRCRVCKATLACPPETEEHFRRYGWPLCHGERMAFDPPDAARAVGTEPPG